MLATHLQPYDTWSKCLEYAVAWTLCLWLHGLSRSTVDMINCCQHRCSIHVSTCLTVSTWNVRRPWWTMLVHWVVRAFSSPIAFRRQALQLRQKRSSFMEVVREQDVAHHVLRQSLSMKLNSINLFGGGCGVFSASAGWSIDSTWFTAFLRCVVQASSSPMSQVASLKSMTFSRI